MGEVRSMRTPPLPSPAEAPSPVVAPHSHYHGPSQSISGLDNNGYAIVDGNSTMWKADARSFMSREQTANSCHIPSFSKQENSNSGNGSQEDQGRGLQTLKELRRQMEELLVYQQMQQSQSQDSSTGREADPVPPAPLESSAKRRTSDTSSLKLAPPSASTIPSASYPDSTGSSGTIRAIESLTIPDNPAGQTPSYPFPKMQSQSNARHPQDPVLNHGHFKLTLPSEKLKIHMAAPQILDERQSTASRTPTSHPVFLPAQHKSIIEDPAYPSPNLYDLTLRLNADPGLDAWWANVVHILQTYYGAVRASLALPGDVTDLENVPWGQKAVFDQNVGNGSETLPIVGDGSLKNCGDTEKKIEDLAGGNVANGLGPAAFSKRPQLFSRHSFAGFGKEKKSTWQDSDKLQNIQKTKETPKSENQNPVPFEREPSQATPNQENTAHDMQSSNPTASSRNYQRQAVFPIPRPLEVEADPLIKRAGVVKLFGRTEPVVLTREYSQNLVAISKQAHGEIVQPPEDRFQVTPTAEPSQPTPQTSLPTHVERSRSASNASVLGPQAQNVPLSMHFYDEYEQVPPSPWSQSPAPSPAPRAHADQNPFFTNHAVDEGAFAKHPPSHDYSNMEPLEAIGIDLAKSVVHIPLLHAGRLKQPSSTTLRFPVAVISILSPIIPYPSNLRQSLAYLIPHLTTSFCLAQQYSQLERQFASRLELPRYGHLLGLGGTFSDESSELELFAGLSGHVNYALADDGSLSAHASFSSPDERSTKLSPSMSGFGTPGFDLNNLGTGSAVNSSESPGLALKGSGEAVDSYFSVKQSRSFREAMSQHRNRLSKAKRNSSSSTPTSPGKLWGKPADEEVFTQDPSIVPASPAQEFKMPPIISPTQASSRHPSTNSFYSQLHRELPRPFSDTDTVAQLMLNSVPLHLFLARPQSGEVIWTNSKFDAYRRSQPQEQKLRDPWQNIHLSERDHISQEWANALRTGSQFTERVRVKRFNDESTYRWFIFRANPLLSSTGEVLYWIGSFLDIHEQHVVELKAAQERERSAIDAKYRAFSNSIPQVVFEAAEYRGLIFANEQWHLYTGQKLEEALNFGFAKHVHPDDLEKCGLLSLYLAESQNRFAVESSDSTGETEKANAVPPERHFNPGVTRSLDELVRRGVASVQKDENGRVFYSTEIRFRSRGGDFRWHLVRILRVETSSFGSGEASWYGTCTDINDRKNLERELNKAMQQLNSQMESKTKFFSNMSHEIRTPLNGILGTIPFILDTQLDTDQRRMLDTIQNSSTNLRELVDNILDVSRVEAGKMSLVNSWFHVRSVIEDVIDTISSRAIDKGLEINYLMDVDVPPTVIGDRFRIRQVLINLVGNAVKFTAQGEIYIRCSVYHDASALSKETELLLNFDVVDTGKGFNARDTERLMQRFSQLGPNASQQHAGSGLGLFLSKQLVEMHGGRLTPSSTEGQGSKFSFYVKVDAPPPPSPNEQSSEMPGVQLTPSSLQKSPFSSKEFIDFKGQDASDLSTALSAHFASNNLSQRSSISSAHPTSDLHTAEPLAKIDTAKPVSSQSDIFQSRPNTLSSSSSDALSPMVQRTSLAPKRSSIPSKPLPLSTGSTSSQSQSQYSILILCPFNNTRKAIEQHIEQVVPLEIPFSITSLLDVEDWRDSMNHGSGSKPTHLVLNLPSVDDILDMIQHVLECEIAAAPTLLIISDPHQKRQINSRIKELSLSGRRVYTVLKPVKPSAFSTIFDPNNRRELSKDRNQDMAREMNNNFKTMYKMVKEVIGNKGYRILLVEDDETNRMVMLKYLDKIKVMAETATNGQEATELVFSKEPGYYSLIICDIQMPVKNGYETCRDIRAWEAVNHYPQIPIMALSANAMTDQIEDAARAGFNDYVTKPIKHNELGKMLMELLDHNRPLILLRDRFKSDYEDHLSDISHGQ